MEGLYICLYKNVSTEQAVFEKWIFLAQVDIFVTFLPFLELKGNNKSASDVGSLI